MLLSAGQEYGEANTARLVTLQIESHGSESLGRVERFEMSVQP